MHKEGTESWRIVESSDLSLNFALFTGCLYGFIDDVDGISNNSLWPRKCEINKLTESFLC